MPDALDGVPANSAQILLKEAMDPHLSNMWASAKLKDDAPDEHCACDGSPDPFESKGLEPPTFGHRFVDVRIHRHGSPKNAGDTL